MAEALGIAASISGLITIADIIVRKGYKFLKDAKDADKTVRKLVDEVNGLAGVLHSLNNVVERLEEDSTGFDPSTQIHYVKSCYQTLVKLQGHFDKALPSVPMSRMERLIWPLKQSQTKELLQDVGRHKTTMVLAMSATEMSALLQILSRQDKFDAGLDMIMAGLEDDRVTRKTVKLNDARHKMLDFLGRSDPGKWQDTNIRLRKPGTGIWFTDGPELKCWLSNAQSRLWVYGIPGAGKTILMASTIQEIQKLANAETATAFFYCDYKYPETHDALTILGSLARQLVVQHEDCFADLDEFYQQHIKLDRAIRAPDADELCAFIIKLSSHFRTTMIVVDGLDEISKNRAGVTRLLRTLNCISSTVKTLFASRPEIDIRDELEDFAKISIAAQSSDLRLYVASEIEKRTRERRLKIRDPELKEHIIKALVDGAHGMFRWVSCQMDYLCECSTDKARREALQKLPPDLPSSYERILDRINRSTKENQDLVRNALHWILHAKGRISTVQILQALATNDEDNFDSHAITTEDELLSWCSSLVRRNIAGDGLELAHFTVKEFLLQLESNGEPARLRYRLSNDHSVLAKACINFFKCQTFDGEPAPKLEPDEYEEATEWDLFQAKYPFSTYASKFLFNHVYSSEWAHIDKCIMAIFAPKRDDIFEFWSSAVQYNLIKYMKSQHFSDGVIIHLNPSLAPGPLHIAAFYTLGKVCAKLIQDGLNINEQSYLGNPFNCALRSYGAYYVDPDTDIGMEGFLSLHSTRGGVLRLLLDAGTDINNAQDPEATSQIVFLTHRHYCQVAHVKNKCLEKDFFMEHMAILFSGGARFSVDYMEYIDPNHPDPLDPWEVEQDVEIFIFSIFKLVLSANGTNLMPNAVSHFLKLFLRGLAAGCPTNIWEPAFRLDPGLFSVTEIEDLKLSRSCTSSGKLGALVKTLCLAIVRTSTDPYGLVAFWNDVFYAFVECGPLSAIMPLLEAIPSVDLYHPGKYGCNALELVTRREMDDGPEHSYLSAIRLLLNCGFKATETREYGHVPIETAAQYGNLSEFQLLWSSFKGHSGLQHFFDHISGLSFSVVQKCFCLAVYGNNKSVTEYLEQECSGYEILSESSLISFVDNPDTKFRSESIANVRAKIVEWFECREIDTQSWERCTTDGANGNLEYAAIDRKALPIVAGPHVPLARFQEMVERGFFPLRGELSISSLVPILMENGNPHATQKLRVLLEKNPEAWTIGDKGLHLLQIATKRNNESAVTMLLNCGANPNIIHGPSGDNCLHIAARYGFQQLAVILFRNDCDVEHKNLNGVTPAELAKNYGFENLWVTLHTAATERSEHFQLQRSNQVTNHDFPSTSGIPSKDRYVDLPLRGKISSFETDSFSDTQLEDFGMPLKDSSSDTDYNSRSGLLPPCHQILLSASTPSVSQSDSLKRCWDAVSEPEPNGDDKRLRARYDPGFLS